jgi:hypothetical protein
LGNFCTKATFGTQSNLQDEVPGYARVLPSTQQTSITTSTSSWYQCHLSLSNPKSTTAKRDFQVIDNWITLADSYFALTHAEPPDIYHYLNTILTREAATWFLFIYRNANPKTVTWEAVKTSVKAYFVPPNNTRRIRDEWASDKQLPSPTIMPD